MRYLLVLTLVLALVVVADTQHSLTMRKAQRGCRVNKKLYKPDEIVPINKTKCETCSCANYQFVTCFTDRFCEMVE